MTTEKNKAAEKFDLKASKICKSYGGTVAVKDFSLTILGGEVFGLIGDNGTGKSTIMRIMALIDKMDSGEIYINGLDACENAKHFRTRIGYIPQANALIEEMTAVDNLKLFSLLDNKATAEKIDELSKAFDMDRFLHKKVKHLSGGMARRVNIAAGLINAPSFIVADEPFTGLDATQRAKVIGYLENLAKDGVGQLISSHYAQNLESWSKSIITI